MASFFWPPINGGGSSTLTLTGDVTGSGSGSVSTTVVSAGGGTGTFSAGNILLPQTTATIGQIQQYTDGDSGSLAAVLHTYNTDGAAGAGNWFMGAGGNGQAGNFTLVSTVNPQTGSTDGNIGILGGTLNSLTTGANNTAIGGALTPALIQLTSGYSNIQIGDGLNAPITVEHDNVSIGGFRALDLVAGNGNTALGSFAGTVSIPFTDAEGHIDYSTYIGYGAAPSSTSGVVNETVLGCNATGQGSNTVQLGATTVTLVNTSGQVRCASLGVANSATASVAVGTLTYKIQVFDGSGASLGYIPVYATIT
jgi:hypothetical protein